MQTLRKHHEIAEALIGVEAIIWEARTGGPVRTLITGTRVQATGRYASYKNGRAQPWESTFEFPLFWLCEVDPAVVSYTAQPHLLEILTEQEALHYYPDLRKDYIDGSVEIIEVGSDGDRRKRDPQYIYKLERCRYIYEELLGWRFTQVRGEGLRESPPFINAKAIQRDRRSLVSVADELRIVDLAMARGQPFTYGEACEVLGGFPGGKKILHAMMARGLVSIDLSRIMTLDTPVRLIDRSGLPAWVRAEIHRSSAA